MRHNVSKALSMLTKTGFALALCVASTSHALSDALVINGETIANAKLVAAAKKEGNLTIYGVIPTSIYNPLLKAFKTDTGLEVEFVRLPTKGLYSRVKAEFGAGKLAADFVDLSDPVLLQEFVSIGILSRPYKVPNFDKISDKIKDPQGRWYAEIRQVQAIGVNTAIVKPADYPKSWNDLLDPKWKGKIGMGAIDAGGSHFIAQSYLRDVIDKNFWSKFAAQKPRIYSSLAPVLTNLTRGEVSIGLAAAASFLARVKKGAPIQVVFPVEGGSSFFVGGGVTSTAKNPNAARLYLNWITSVRGGTVISKRGIYGSHPDSPVPVSPGLTFPPLSKVWGYGADEWTKKRGPYSKEWRKTFGVK